MGPRRIQPKGKGTLLPKAKAGCGLSRTDGAGSLPQVVFVGLYNKRQAQCNPFQILGGEEGWLELVPDQFRW